MGDVAAPARTRTRWLTPSVIGFGVASFLSDAGHEAATAALPGLLLLLGAQPAALGIIEGVSDGLSSFAKLAGGWWADRPAVRKPIAVAGYIATGLASGAFGLATAWWHVLVSRSVAWFARGVRGPSRDAMLSDAVPREALGRAFGLHRAADTGGAIVGPAVAAALLAVVPLRHVFAWAAIPGTRVTLTEPFFRRGLEEAGVEVAIPDDDGIRYLDDLIFGPLASGRKSPAMKEEIAAVVRRMAARTRFGALVVACTDLMDLLDVSLPLLDPIDSHVRLAAERLLEPAAPTPTA